MCNVVTCALHPPGCSETESLRLEQRGQGLVSGSPLSDSALSACFVNSEERPWWFSYVFIVETKAPSGKRGM